MSTGAFAPWRAGGSNPRHRDRSSTGHRERALGPVRGPRRACGTPDPSGGMELRLRAGPGRTRSATGHERWLGRSVPVRDRRKSRAGGGAGALLDGAGRHRPPGSSRHSPPKRGGAIWAAAGSPTAQSWLHSTMSPRWTDRPTHDGGPWVYRSAGEEEIDPIGEAQWIAMARGVRRRPGGSPGPRRRHGAQAPGGGRPCRRRGTRSGPVEGARPSPTPARRLAARDEQTGGEGTTTDRPPVKAAE